MKYKIIKEESQYLDYCKQLEKLLRQNDNSKEDEIELLTLLIEKCDEEQYQIPDLDPIEILKALMEDHQLKAKDLTDILSLSKGTVSKILNYQKGLSKDTIRKLAAHFKLSQEIFNRPYELNLVYNEGLSNEALMNTKKEMTKTA